MNKMNAYMCLLRADGSEPPAESGYCRAALGEIDTIELPQLLQDRRILFPDVRKPGYGNIAAVGVSDRPGPGGPLLWCWPQEEALDFHEGVVPLIIDGKLCRGIDMKVTKIIRTGSRAEA